MIRVFYDGKCGLCAKEINHYKKISPEGVFEWCDILESEDKLKEAGLTVLEALKEIHAQDAEGNLHIGVDAFLLLWRQLKRWRILAAIVGFPGIYFVSCQLYKLFAWWRFRRLKHCQVAAEEAEKK